MDCDSHGKYKLFQVLIRQHRVIGRCRRSGFAPPPAIRAAAGSRPAGGPCRWHSGAAASRPTSARAMAAPRRARSGRGDCGGAPTAIRGRGPSCRFGRSGPKTPGARTPQAAITTSRCGWNATTAATGSRRDDHLYDFIVEIDHNSSPAHRRPRQRGIPASGAREFLADRRMRLDDEIGDAAVVGAAGAGDEDRDRVSILMRNQNHARQKPDSSGVTDPARSLARRHQARRPRSSACGRATAAEAYAIQAEIENHSAGNLFGWKIAATSEAGQKHINVDGPMAGTHPVRDRHSRWRHRFDGGK